MQLPVLLPEKLFHYSIAETDDELFTLMLKQPADFVVFFDYAVDDEAWLAKHSLYIHKALTWFTNQHFQERLSWDVGKLLTKLIQPHYRDLSSQLPANLTIQLRDQEVQVNSLVFASSSTVFRDLVHIECFEKNNNFVSLDVSKDQFEVIEEFINTGDVAALWRYSQSEIIKLLKKATLYGLFEFKKVCEETLKRYVDGENAIKLLLRSYKNSWNILEERCCYVINGMLTGIHLDPLEQKRKNYIEITPQKPFAVEFLNFSDQALSQFYELKSIVSHIICGGILPAQRELSEIFQACPHIIALDVSRSREYSERLLEGPLKLKDLDVSQCSWLTDDTLIELLMIYPKLSRLAIGSNTQLSFLSWSELRMLKNLIILDISRCNQIVDDDMSLIIKNCPAFIELNIEDCRKLSERAFFEIALSLPGILHLNVARSRITDAALLEFTARHSQLRSLDISRCTDLSEKGIIHALKQLKGLKELRIKNSEISALGLQQIQQILPNCNLEF